jgi:hypothetical protein
MLQKIVILLLILLCLSCHENENQLQLPAIRTVLVYMVAGNNLYKNAKQDIAEMQAISEKINGNLIVYLDAPENSVDSVPQLFKILDGKIEVIKKYKQHNSASGKILEQVINDVIATFPAMEYGLVLWSHGTGWLPEGAFDSLKMNQKTRQRSFGLDNDKEMGLIELSHSLPIRFKFILFDACLMANIEVFYQLRNNANYIIASPTETLVAGFPYTQTIPLLLQKEIDFDNVAKEYVNYYENQSKSILKSASLSVIRTEYLKNLVDFIKLYVDDKTVIISDFNNLQFYEIDEPILYFDLLGLLNQIIVDENNRKELSQIISKIILCYQHTDNFLNNLSLGNSSGLSVFVFPFYNESLLYEYKKTDWYIETDLLFNRKETISP